MKQPEWMCMLFSLLSEILTWLPVLGDGRMSCHDGEMWEKTHCNQPVHLNTGLQLLCRCSHNTSLLYPLHKEPRQLILTAMYVQASFTKFSFTPMREILFTSDVPKCLKMDKVTHFQNFLICRYFLHCQDAFSVIKSHWKLTHFERFFSWTERNWFGTLCIREVRNVRQECEMGWGLLHGSLMKQFCTQTNLHNNVTDASKQNWCMSLKI